MCNVAEEWRKVEGDANYEVSNRGRVRSIARGNRKGRVLKPSSDKSGYRKVSLSLQTTRKIHQLVAASWIGPRPCGQEVNHIDGCKSNNDATNLEYATKSENQLHAYSLGLKEPTLGEKNGMASCTASQIIEGMQLILGGMPIGKAAKSVGVGYHALSDAKRGKTWRHLEKQSHGEQ